MAAVAVGLMQPKAIRRTAKSAARRVLQSSLIAIYMYPAQCQNL